MISKLKNIFRLIFTNDGVIFFRHKPVVGDTITINDMIAEFKKKA